MSIFSREESKEEWRHKRSQEQLAAGGLPLNAEFRLRRRRENGKIFTSFLSVNELVLATSNEIRPLCQVTGSCVFYLGWNPKQMFANSAYGRAGFMYGNAGFSYGGVGNTTSEIFQLSAAQHQVRQLAINRMLLEAKDVGAHGVIGVKLQPVTFDWGRGMVEVVATGTAIAWKGAEPAATPFACNLSGQEFRTLLDAGYLPLGLTFGTCAMYLYAGYMTQVATQRGIFGTTGVNQEMTEYTHCFYEARRNAILRMEDQANALSAHGILNLSIEKNMQIHEVEVDVNDTKQHRNNLIVQFTALGTAIHAYRDHLAPIDAILPLT
jgi:uncharacterized protein YbjQ (UPF0145 family)